MKRIIWLVLAGVILLAAGWAAFSSLRADARLKRLAAAEVVYTRYDSGPVAAALLTQKGDLLQVSSDGSKIIYTAPSGAWVVIYLDQRGLPVKMIESCGVIIHLANYTETTVDVAVVAPDGKVTTQRKVPLTVVLTSGQLGITNLRLLKQAEQLSVQGMEKDSPRVSNELSLFADLTDGQISGKDAINSAIFASKICVGVSTVIAGVTVAAAATTAGAAIVPAGLAVFALAGMVVGIEHAFMDNEALEVASDEFNTYSCATVAISPNPIGGVLSCASLAMEDRAEAIEARQSTASSLALASLTHGTGDVQVTLTWDNTSDVDLWVTDPNGESVGFRNKTVRSGGHLDVDDTDGYGPENIFWPRGKAPAGEYKVYVHHYKARGVPHYKVLVRVNGTERNFEGTLNPNERKEVWSFTVAPESLRM